VWALWALLLVPCLVLAARLRRNFIHQPGDLLEGALNRMMDIQMCIQLASDGSRRECRSTALELGSLAAAGDANKQAIMDHGGVAALLSLALRDDPQTVRFAVEAITEMLALPTCREPFVHAGCIRCLLAVSHTAATSTSAVVAVALHYLVREEANCLQLADSGGLNELTKLALRPGL